MPVLLEPVIYRLVEAVSDRCADLLPKLKETRVLGEALVQQLFEISKAGGVKVHVAGCRVSNGAISKGELARVMRDGKEVFEGKPRPLALPSTYVSLLDIHVLTVLLKHSNR